MLESVALAVAMIRGSNQVADSEPSAAATPTPIACPADGLTWNIVTQFNATTALANPACVIDLGRDGKLLVTITFGDAGLSAQFSFAQTSVTTQHSLLRNDTFWMEIFAGHSGFTAKTRVFAAIIDPNFQCASLSVRPSDVLTHNQCKVSGPHHAWTTQQPYWSGTLSIPLTVLNTVAPPGDATLFFLHSAYLGSPDPIVETATIKGTFVRGIKTSPFISGGPDIGQPAGVPPHRTVLNPYLPIFPGTIATATFSDDSGKLLSIRNTATKGLINAADATAFQCQSCGSFQSSNATVFQSPITSSNALGLDLSKLGVDETPFDFTAVTYPIDAGYKLYTSNDLADAGIATFYGTSATAGYAHDSVFHAFSSAPLLNGGEIYGGLFDAVASRSVAPPPPTGTYPQIVNRLQHSGNVQGSLGFISPLGNARSVLFDGNVLSALLRYGAQDAAEGNTFDAAVSIQRAPALASVTQAQPDRTSVTGAAGFRRVGAGYDPIDGVYDVHTGESGPYLLVDLKRPTSLNGSFELTGSGYRFHDSIEARDVATSYGANYYFSTATSLKTSYQIGEIAISQVGRDNNIVVSDAHGGMVELPNGGLSLSLNTAPVAALQLTAGYTTAKSQGCNTTLIKSGPPCYAFTAPSGTGGIHWSPFPKAAAWKSLFAEGGIQNSSDTLFPDGSLALPKSAALTSTSVRIVRSASLGTKLFTNWDSGCSTLLVTDAGRGGDVNDYAKSAPQPGRTETASLEIVPGPWTPSILVAYSLVQNTAPSPSQTSLFVVRVQYAILPPSYAEFIRSSCPSST